MTIRPEQPSAFSTFSGDARPESVRARRRIQAGDGHPLCVWAQERGIADAALCESTGLTPAQLHLMNASADYYPEPPVLRALCLKMGVHPCDLLPFQPRAIPTAILATLIGMVLRPEDKLTVTDTNRAYDAILQEWERIETMKRDPARARDVQVFARADLLFHRERQEGQSRAYAAQGARPLEAPDEESFTDRLMEDPWQVIDARTIMRAEDRLIMLFNMMVGEKDKAGDVLVQYEKIWHDSRAELQKTIQALWGFKAPRAIEAMNTLHTDCCQANPPRDILQELRRILMNPDPASPIPVFYNGGEGLRGTGVKPLNTYADRVAFFLERYAQASMGHYKSSLARRAFEKAQAGSEDMKGWIKQIGGQDWMLTLYRNRCLIADCGLKPAEAPLLLPDLTQSPPA